MGWIIFLALAVPLLGVLAWIALDESFVRIESGQLGLVLIKGRATDKALDPGPHWVPAMRRRMVQTYPSLELSYRAGAEDVAAASDLERSGPPLRATLADRSGAVVSYTVRFRLDTASLRTVHERFGPEGIWAVVRDVSEATFRAALVGAGIDDFFGSDRPALEHHLADAVTADLVGAGIVVTMLHLGDVDLGRTGEVIEATSRARHELEREQAEAAMRLARARIDADLAPFAGAIGSELALRYREVDSWRELARTTNVVMPVTPRPPAPEGSAEPAEPQAPSEGER